MSEHQKVIDNIYKVAWKMVKVGQQSKCFAQAGERFYSNRKKKNSPLTRMKESYLRRGE